MTSRVEAHSRLLFDDGNGHAARSRAVTLDEQYRLPPLEIQFSSTTGIVTLSPSTVA